MATDGQSSSRSPTLPPLVLLPGLDGTGRMFAPLCAALEASERALVIAYPTDAPLDGPALLVWVSARLPRGEPYLLVAESFSGPVAMALARAAPPDLAGLVLVTTFCEPPRRPPRWLVHLLLPWLLRLPPPEVALRWLLLGPGAPAALVRTLREALATVRPEVLAQRVREVLAVDARACLSALAIPVLHLQAAQDRLVPARCGRQMAALLPDLTTATLAAPHLLLQRVPQEALEQIRRWWLVHLAPAPRRPGG
jgi:pimeloyl-ACP methyl ester carboxylesterase